MVMSSGLVRLIATAGLATDAPDEGSEPAQSRGRARLQHMSGSRRQDCSASLGPWLSCGVTCADLPEP